MGEDRAGEAAYEAAVSVVARPVGDETIVVDLETERYFSLNATGAVVWSLVSTGEAASTAVAELVHRYDVTVEQARADVGDLVGDLLRAGLLLPRA